VFLQFLQGTTGARGNRGHPYDMVRLEG